MEIRREMAAMSLSVTFVLADTAGREANALEIFRQGVGQEPSNELPGVQAHSFGLTAVARDFTVTAGEL